MWGCSQEDEERAGQGSGEDGAQAWAHTHPGRHRSGAC